MRTITPFLYWETLNTNDGILLIPANKDADDRMAIYAINQVTDTDHATARLRHASFDAPETINLTRINGQLTTTDLADLKAVNIGTREDTIAPTYYAVENDGDITIWHSTECYNDIAIAHAFGTDGETRVIFNEPDEYGNDVLGYNVWSVLQVTEGYEDTENLPDTFNIPEDNTAHLTPETALALYDTINHPEYHALNDQETLEEALTSLWRNISDYYAIPGEMHWVDDAEILWRTKDFLSDVHTAAEKEDSANLTTITSHHINTITSHPDYED